MKSLLFHFWHWLAFGLRFLCQYLYPCTAVHNKSFQWLKRYDLVFLSQASLYCSNYLESMVCRFKLSTFRCSVCGLRTVWIFLLGGWGTFSQGQFSQFNRGCLIIQQLYVFFRLSNITHSHALTDRCTWPKFWNQEQD